MRKSSLASLLLMVSLGAILVGGVVYLFQLRFSAGDIYPPYSSLRSDPRGTRVLFESIDHLPGVEAVRNVRPLRASGADAETTLLLTGVQGRVSPDTVEELETMLEAGARVVVAYAARGGEGPGDSHDAGDPEAAEEGAAPQGEGSSVGLAGRSLGEAFGFGIRFREGLPVDEDDPALRGLRAPRPEWGEAETPDFWFSHLYLEPEPAKDWEVLLRLLDEPVMIQRGHGKGMLVVITDSYWLSNEAMSLTRRTGFVSWILGSPRRVIFEETHLGIAEQQRLSHLMRRLGLESVLAVLLLLAVLFIWKNGVAFPPREAASGASGGGEVKGHDSQKGLVNLLRANIPRKRIFQLCWEEWLKTLEPSERARLAPRMEAAREIVVAEGRSRSGNRDVVNDYRRIAEILNERKDVWKQQIQTSKD